MFHSCTHFSMLCRQINGGKDLPREFLESMFTSIKENEIQVSLAYCVHCVS